MIEIQTITVRLGEKDYTIREAGHLRAGPWKKRLMTEIQPLFKQISEAQGMEFNSPADLLKVWPLFQTVFTDSLETVFAMLVSYSPDLEADRDDIANNATDRQILAAFRGVVALADPFGVAEMLTRQIGLATTGTSSNLPAQNGAAPLPRPKRLPKSKRAA